MTLMTVKFVLVELFCNW